MSDSPQFDHVCALARRLGLPVAVFDLEATTLRGMRDFGITEVCCFVAHPAGSGVCFDNLINPECPISARARQVTGITDDLVRNAEKWGPRYAALFADMAKKCWVTGFNNKTFDEPAVIEVSARYGVIIESFEHSFDVRRLHLELSNAKSTKGTLQEVAAIYGILPRGNLHRAKADVILTLETLDAIIDTYGLDAVCNHILPKAPNAVDKLTSKSLAKYVKSKKQVSLSDVAAAFGKEVSEISFEVGKAIDERMVDPLVFAVQSAQDWLDEALMEVDIALLENTRLKPLFESLSAKQPQAGMLDYVQLRVALTRANVRWSSLKPEP